MSYKLKHIENIDRLTLFANAKINLSLKVGTKRDDGYHNIKTVMQTLLLNDTIFMKKIDEPKVVLDTNIPWLPTDSRNLIFRAAEYMRKEFNIKKGVEIYLTKEIPVSAGLGGGSADCAATLIGMRKLFRIYLPNKDLLNLGLKFGSDVPFMITQGTALVEGKGEIIKALKPHPFVYILLAKPSFSVSTANAFAEYKGPSRVQNINYLLKYIERGNIKGIARNFSNDLEYIISNKTNQIEKIKKIMHKNGSIGMQMSGSGPTVFGYFLNKNMANIALAELFKMGIRELSVTGTFNRKKYR